MTEREREIDKAAHCIIGLINGEAAYEIDLRLAYNRALVAKVKNRLRELLAKLGAKP
jgi:hypothetical protein